MISRRPTNRLAGGRVPPPSTAVVIVTDFIEKESGTDFLQKDSVTGFLQKGA